MQQLQELVQQLERRLAELRATSLLPQPAALDPDEEASPKEAAAAAAALLVLRTRQAQLSRLLWQKYTGEGVPGCGVAALCAVFVYSKTKDKARLNTLFNQQSVQHAVHLHSHRQGWLPQGAAEHVGYEGSAERPAASIACS
jgi:hypothetical protein